MTDLDISELEEIAGPTNEQLTSIASLANRQMAAESQVALLEEQLRAAKDNLQNISWNLLPDAMRACGLAEFKMDTGESIKIKEEVRASISEINRPVALKWLRDHKHGAIIKNNITVPLSPAEGVEQEVIQFLDQHNLQYDQKQAVNVRTLASWVKEQLAQGNEVPPSISYFEQRISKVVK